MHLLASVYSHYALICSTAPLQTMLRITSMRGAQSAGLATFSHGALQPLDPLLLPTLTSAIGRTRLCALLPLTPLRPHPFTLPHAPSHTRPGARGYAGRRARVVNGKRTDLPSLLLRRARGFFRDGWGEPLLQPPTLYQGHTRFATSSISSLDGTHPHQWTPAATQRVWCFDTRTGTSPLPTPSPSPPVLPSP